MAGAYLLRLNREIGGGTFLNDVDSLIVWAEDATTAKQIAKAQQIGTAATDAAWDTVTPLLLAATADFEGWRLRVVIKAAAVGGGDIDITVTGAASATMAAIAALMVTALNARAEIAGAAYATGTLTIAETTDNLGDKTVQVYVYPPAADTANFPAGTAISFTGLYGTITHEGLAGAALSVVLDTSAPVPTLLARLRQ